MQVTSKKEATETQFLLLAYDLYWLRYIKRGQQWYELTDYLRQKLVEDGHRISYTDDDVIFNGLSIKRIAKHK